MSEDKPKYGVERKPRFSVENAESFSDICNEYIRQFILNNPIGAVSGTIEIHFKGTRFEFKYQNLRVTD
jgi:hypothetical protein